MALKVSVSVCFCMPIEACVHVWSRAIKVSWCAASQWCIKAVNQKDIYTWKCEKHTDSACMINSKGKSYRHRKNWSQKEIYIWQWKKRLKTPQKTCLSYDQPQVPTHSFSLTVYRWPSHYFWPWLNETENSPPIESFWGGSNQHFTNYMHPLSSNECSVVSSTDFNLAGWLAFSNEIKVNWLA